jgi:ACS family allantoate permease-like MFS transporter
MLICLKKLVGQQYSWCSSIFYFGYLVGAVPGSVGFVKFPLAKYIGVTIFLWAVILACHGAATNFAGLLILRFLLGVLESVVSPGFSLTTGLYYKPSEHAWRHGLWFSGNGFTTVFGGVLGYAIGLIKSNVSPWRWLFIILGIITFTWSLVVLVFLPENALSAKWLTPQQRVAAYRRPQRTTHSFKST